jgi:hypothetical protein
MRALAHFQNSHPLTQQSGLDWVNALARWIKRFADFFMITPEVLTEAGIQTERQKETKPGF